jgi:hypothetical protein
LVKIIGGFNTSGNKIIVKFYKKKINRIEKEGSKYANPSKGGREQLVTN